MTHAQSEVTRTVVETLTGLVGAKARSFNASEVLFEASEERPTVVDSMRR